jgi:hypothetical protein
MMSSANKKAKTVEATDADFEQVRQYILACPHVSNEHPAIAAAVKGIEQEMKRRERDAKLRQKFMQDAVTIEKPADASTLTSTSTSVEFASRTFDTNTNEPPLTSGHSNSNSITNSNTDPADADETMTDDWHDVTSDSSPKQEGNGEQDEATGFLGKCLSRQAIAAIADHQVRVKSPLAAVALALHAAMRSETLGFSCTGVPDDTDGAGGSTGGFAPPIRELPKKQFLPRDWDKHAEKVTLRYRKNGTGSLILKVVGQQQATAQEKDIVVEVTLYTTSTGEPPSDSLVFSISDHINLDSWARALRDHATVPPALHYKGLSMLLSNFAKTFDLGNVVEGKDTATIEQVLPYVDTTIQSVPSLRVHHLTNPGSFQPAPPPPMRPVVVNQPWDNGWTPTIENSFPGLRTHGPPGDFAGDLAPGGILAPGFGQVSPGMGGNLMGPNHPAFTGGPGMSGVGPNSGLGMRPRFDPFGPPGGPTDPNGLPENPNNPNRNRRPGGTGDPNPDHMRPPNNLGNNMFM